jgi:hypothetical protein
LGCRAKRRSSLVSIAVLALVGAVGCATRGSEAAPAKGSNSKIASQVVAPGDAGTSPVTDEVVLGRIDDAARGVPKNGVAPRIALAALAYPRTQREFVAMGGFGLLLVTALSHDPAELPIAKVVSEMRGEAVELPLVASRVGQPPNAKIPSVFGKARFDGIYLFPVFITRLNTKIVVYLGGGRFPVHVMNFPAPPEEDGMPSELDLDFEPREPSVDAMLKLLEEELPILKGAPLAGS